MNPDRDNQLEMEIRRELKALPELTAPASVVNRVMAAIERCSKVPWYRRSWETWPVAVQATSLTAMLILFGDLCFAGWELSQADTVAQAMQRAGQCFSGFNTIGSTLNILAGSAVLVIKKLGAAFIIAALVAAGLSYTLFLGLGTVYFRLAFTKRQ